MLKASRQVLFYAVAVSVSAFALTALAPYGQSQGGQRLSARQGSSRVATHSSTPHNHGTRSFSSSRLLLE
jgi:hypothetical protein